MKKEVAALVILYHYDKTCIENIKSYASQADVVFTFDNTEDCNKNEEFEHLLKSIEHVKYVNGHGNQGLSYAINKIAHRCIKEGYQWLITFDQDSAANGNMVEVMRKFIHKYKNIDEVGILSPIIKNADLKYSEPVYEFSYVDCVIQSGAMHNLKAYEAIRGYDNKIFIDQLDIEYCYRLTDKGYKILRLNHAILLHNVSDKMVKLKYLHGRKYYINKFSPMRYYYIMRNNLYCLFKYRSKNKLYCADLKRNIEVLLQTWILEEKKSARARAMLYGIIDFLLRNMGKSDRRF